MIGLEIKARIFRQNDADLDVDEFIDALNAWLESRGLEGCMSFCTINEDGEEKAAAQSSIILRRSEVKKEVERVISDAFACPWLRL